MKDKCWHAGWSEATIPLKAGLECWDRSNRLDKIGINCGANAKKTLDRIYPAEAGSPLCYDREDYLALSGRKGQRPHRLRRKGLKVLREAIGYFQFRPEIENANKHPEDPVDPV